MSSPPATLQAAVQTRHGGLDKLEFHREWPTPAPGPGTEPHYDSLDEPVAVYH